MLDLCNHFQAQYFGFLSLLVLWLVIRRQFRAAAIPSLLALIPGVRLAELWFPRVPLKPQTLQVTTFNVYGGNNRYETTVTWAIEEGSDFLYFAEATPEWIAELSKLDEAYPYSIDHPLNGSFGFAFRSKHPFHLTDIQSVGRLALPLLDTVIQTPSGEIRVLGAHPVPPATRFWADERDAYLAELRERAARSNLPTVIVGDLNATRWSHAMTGFWEDGYIDSARGHGFSATWSRENPILAVPIDHILTRGLGPCVLRSTGPKLGSDHRPVTAGFDFRPARETD
ncbi:hypothetical protein HAHE_40380 [Haloferula helveola]|uniref:Endonuclease/exonuclease/phosphatase domain-containing protein n=1 Tax=Haloferula helveola TaxID=490095 RepID=A0ABM7RPU5_9BACT|nr:hypothetical protein HAHE_40380 [Haloferula helveola]